MDLTKIMMFVFLLLTTMVGPANSSDLEDFVNNLNTDLAPLLALLGERPTMQFISQAVGFADCFILAMVPLGIMTIIVSAIRVGGPTWLKALVGRAKENRAVAELELMSSTSQEVCELYNGKHIVRCLGSGSIRQYICLFKKGPHSSEGGMKKFKVEFKTLDEALRHESLIQIEGPDLVHKISIAVRSKLEWIWSGFRQTVLPTHSNHLRFQFSGHRVPQQPDTQPTLIVIHDIEPEAPNVALNLQKTYGRTRIGVAAFFGALVQMAIVGFFVYTDKHPKFQLKKGKPTPDYALPAAITGTLFLALGVFFCAHVVEKSTTETLYRADDNFEMVVHWIQHKQTVNDQVFEPFAFSPGVPCSIVARSRRNRANDTLQSFKTVVGVLFGVSGTVIQFVGLRGMNSIASLAQLVAIGFVTIIRCIARPGFTNYFVEQNLAAGFELDWLAKKLVMKARNTIEDPKFAPWRIILRRGAKHPTLKPLTSTMIHQPTDSEAQSILLSRRGLNKLTKICHKSNQTAANLATALEVALDTVFPYGPRRKGAKGFRWFLNARICEQDQTEPVWIDFRFNGKSWKVEVDDLVAVLSLWTSVPPSKHAMSVPQAWEDIGPIEVKCEDEAYANKTRVIHDMKTWAPQDHETLEAIEEIREGWREVTCSNFSTWSHCKVPMDTGSLLDVYATYLSYSFMWSMAGTLEDPLSGKTDCRRNATSDSNEEETTLWNSHLTRLAKAFARVSVRSEQETLLEIIWSLSVAGKLPRPPDLFTSMSKKVTYGYRSGELKYFNMATIEALNLIQAHADNTSGISERAAAWLLELFHSMKGRVEQSYGLRPTDLRGWHEFLRSRIKNAIRINLAPDFLGHMTRLYSRQGREMDDGFYQSTDKELPAHLEATPLVTDDGVPPEQCDFVNLQDVTGWTPLHHAAASRNAKVAGRLINLDPNVGLKDFSGLTAAHHACSSGSWDILEMLIDKGAQLDSQANNGASPMHLAAGEGHLHVVGNLLKNEARERRKSMVQGRPIKTAPSILKDFDGRMPVHWAAAGGHIPVVEMFKGNLNSQDKHGLTPLHLAVLAGHKRLLGSFYGMSADREIKDMNGRTPLVLACSEGKWEVIQELVDAGAELDAVDSQGRTALHYMADREATTALISIITERVDHTAAVHLTGLQDQSGSTPLHLAAGHGNSAIVDQLLEAGAEPNATNNKEETPLLLGLCGAMTENEAYQIVKALVGHGDRLEARSAEGESPIDVARRRNFSSVVSYLEAELEEREEEQRGVEESAWGAAQQDDGSVPGKNWGGW